MAAVHRLDNSKFRVYECEALPGVAYPGVRDNRSTLNTKTRYDDMASDFYCHAILLPCAKFH